MKGATRNNASSLAFALDTYAVNVFLRTYLTFSSVNKCLCCEMKLL